MRPLVCAVSLWMLAGCHNQSASFNNPFVAPDRVPPPATQVLAPGSAQPYYPAGSTIPAPVGQMPPPPPSYGGIGQPSIPPPSMPTYTPQTAPAIPGAYPTPGAQRIPPPSSMPPAGGGAYSPSTSSVQPSSFNILQASVQQPIDSRPGDSGQGSMEPSASELSSLVSIPADKQQLRFNPPIVPVGAPATRSVSGWSTVSRSPPHARQSELSPSPPIGSGVASGLGSYEKASAGRQAAERFGYGSRYEWLRGQLEYFHSNKQWHIRYQPRNQAGAVPSDQYGGSLPVGNPHLLGELRPGDYVLVQGRLQRSDMANSSAPWNYVVSVVQRQQ
jgi:hypothetical protein